ncbi:uncharacterized protein LTHEOB_5093 [Lasiodiplodia theobromae]|uniref:uncharacterized protein n=1 Tax=Lasiodiplodia theobromae TaxID=45133 RepID=UPI0015C351A5|nr:uncharacterized protein LTHEOB_5093 [Lasiodiplodia theobromae]KAF4545260.1 hypothetical protein LTHEOB_5093 [Lasiodiplodia theobromae]
MHDTNLYNCSWPGSQTHPYLNCTYTPQDNRFPSVTAFIVDLKTLDTMTFFRTMTQTFAEHDLSSLMRFTAVKTLGDLAHTSNGTKVPSDAEVTTCSMEFCVHTHRNVAVRNARLESKNYTTKLPPMPDRFENATSMRWHPNPKTGVYTLHDAASNSSRTYRISAETAYNWQNYFSKFFTLLVGDDGSSEVHVKMEEVDDISNTAAASLYTSNISEVVDNVARTVTHLMRSDDNHNTTQMLGNTYITETYIHVEWVWLAVPLLITTLSVLLLVLSIMQSSSKLVLTNRDARVSEHRG